MDQFIGREKKDNLTEKRFNKDPIVIYDRQIIYTLFIEENQT